MPYRRNNYYKKSNYSRSNYRRPQYKRRRWSKQYRKKRQQMLSVKTVEKIATKQAKKELDDVVESIRMEYYYGENNLEISPPQSLIAVGETSSGDSDFRIAGSLNLYNVPFIRPLTIFNNTTTKLVPSIFSSEALGEYYQNGSIDVMKFVKDGELRKGDALEQTYLKVMVDMYSPPEYTKATQASDTPLVRTLTHTTKVRCLIVRARQEDLDINTTVFPEVNQNINNIDKEERVKYSVLADKTFTIKGNRVDEQIDHKYFTWKQKKPKKYKFVADASIQPMRNQLYIILRSNIKSTHAINADHPYGQCRPQCRVTVVSYTKDT